MKMFTYLLEALLLLLLLMAAGCASFPGNELPPRGYDGLAIVPPKAIVDYDITFHGPGDKNYYTATHLFSQRVKDVFDKSGVFAHHSLDGKDAPTRLSITLENSGDMKTAMLLGIVSGLSLTVIPVYITDNYELKVKVTAGDRFVKDYAYKDHMTTWFQLFLIAAFPSHKPGDVSSEVFDNMLRHFLHDAQADGVFGKTERNIAVIKSAGAAVSVTGGSGYD